MADTVADFIWKRLHHWGARRVYGYPGDGIGGLVGALHRMQKEARDDADAPCIDFVQVRHEEMAGLCASAHAKFTGEVGLCMATSGPGAIHLLNGLYDAKGDHMPVVALVGQQARSAMGSHYQQDVDLQSLLKDVAGAFVQTATVPAQVPHLIDRAWRIAKGDRAVTAVILPNDLQVEKMEDRPHEHFYVQSGVGLSRTNPVPGPDALAAAAEVLNAGEKVAILIGAGAKGAAAEVTQVADLLGAGVAKALLGKQVLPDALPWVTGSMGLLGTPASHELMQGCDTLLMVGTGFPYAEFLPKPGQARGVQIDLSAGMLGLRYPTEVNLLGDAAATLRALIPLLTRKEDRGWRDSVERSVTRSREALAGAADEKADPINPQRITRELTPRLPDGAIVSADSGTTTVWWARDLDLREGMMGSVSGTLATMGCAVPYAIAAKFAHPDRVSIALAGDGAMQMNGMAELITIARYWKTWADPRLIVMVLNNRELAFVTWEERTQIGDPKYPSSQDLPDIPYADVAKLMGLGGRRVERPEDIGPAWDEALAADRPFVLDILADPNVAPLPPHITLKQARSFANALWAEEDRVGVVRGAARQIVGRLLPGD